MFAKLFITLCFLAVLFPCALSQNQYPVPIPLHGRQAVHGWLIMPVDQNLPDWRDTSAPVDAWFSHHVPEFYTKSPHDFQIILRGKLTPLPHAGNEILPILLPYPPKHELLGNEYSFTPPPPFSLNDLLSGYLTELQGVVYNGSFDTSYERIPMSIARLDIGELTTAFYLNYSSEIVPYTYQQYYSYPRSVSWNGESTQHYYMAHSIHAAPDFDQVVHVTVDLANCNCSGDSCPTDLEDVYDILSAGGLSWTFPYIPNTLEERLMPSGEDAWLDAQTLFVNSANYACKVQVLEEIHCMIGPGFAQKCGTYKYYY